MLALTSLYQVDGDTRWLLAAAKSAAQLVETRGTTRDWPADHWMMIASVPLLANYDKMAHPPIAAAALREHIAIMGKKIRATQRPSGYFESDPRSTPAATRLEGLAALATLQRTYGKSIDPALRDSLKRGTKFLLHCQVHEPGASSGGIPRSCASNASQEHRGQEIRIDYVQHFLSALLTQ